MLELRANMDSAPQHVNQPLQHQLGPSNIPNGTECRFSLLQAYMVELLNSFRTCSVVTACSLDAKPATLKYAPAQCFEKEATWLPHATKQRTGDLLEHVTGSCNLSSMQLS